MARALTVVTMLAGLALAAGGCGSSGSDARGVVTLQVFGNAEELKAYRDLVAAYERAGDGKAKLIEVADPQAHLQKLAVGLVSHRPPHVFLVNYRNFAPFAARGALDPVGPRLERSRTLRRPAFFREPLEAFTYRGTLQCLPQNISSLVVYYNRDLFRRAGVPEPGDDWTYADFRRAARKLTEPRRGRNEVRRYGVGVEPGIVRLAPFVWSAGGDIVDDPRDPGRFTLDTPEGREGLRAFLDLRRGGLAPLEQEVEARPLEARFLDGQLGMFLSSRREVPTFRTITGFDWDVAPFPHLRQKASVLHSDAYCIAKGKTAAAAWRFVEFAAGPTGQRILARSGRIVPSLKKVAASEHFLNRNARPRSSQTFLDAIPAIRQLPVASTWPELEDAVDLAIKRAYYTEMTVDEALNRIRKETAPLLKAARDARP